MQKSAMQLKIEKYFVPKLLMWVDKIDRVYFSEFVTDLHINDIEKPPYAIRLKI